MGFYDSYRNLVECGKIGAEKSKEEIMQDIKDEFYELPNYQNVYIEGNARNVHIFQRSSLQTNPEINQMNSYPGETFNTGDYVEWNGIFWLILNDFANKDIQDMVEIRRCRVKINWKSGVTTKSYWAVDKIQSESSHGANIRNSIDQSKGDRLLYVQKNSDTILLKKGTRFILGGNAYSISLVENIDYENVLSIYIRYDESNLAEDDFINDIAKNSYPDFSV